MKGKKVFIIIALVLVGILTIAGALGYRYYHNKIVNESKEHYKKAEALYEEAKYDEAIKEYSLIHKWDTDNYKVKSKKISVCKTNKESAAFVQEAEQYVKEYDYEKAIETYNKVSEADDIYYSSAQNESTKLQQILDNAKFILRHIKSIDKKFGLKNKDITNVYYSKKSGFIADAEVAVEYEGKNDRLYIVTEKKPKESEYMTTYKIKQAPKYISVWGEVQKDTGWLSYSINSLKEETAKTLSDSFELFDKKADELLLGYVKSH